MQLTYFCIIILYAFNKLLTLSKLLFVPIFGIRTLIGLKILVVGSEMMVVGRR